MSSDYRNLAAAARQQGWSVQRRTRHTLLRSPDGRSTACMSSSPSDRRAIHHLVAELRRGGLAWRKPARPSVGTPALKPEEPLEPTCVVAALEISVALYDALVQAGAERSITELSAVVGRSRTDVQRAIGVLAEEGFVFRTGSRSRSKRGVGPEALYAAKPSSP